jgi:hypothetical protein
LSRRSGKWSRLVKGRFRAGARECPNIIEGSRRGRRGTRSDFFKLYNRFGKFERELAFCLHPCNAILPTRKGDLHIREHLCSGQFFRRRCRGVKSNITGGEERVIFSGDRR